MRELRDIARLAAERGQQRPAPEPVPLHQAARTTHREDISVTTGRRREEN
jgi:hypothetical protein